MTRYEKAAKKAIDQYMRQNRDKEDFSLYKLSVVADKAAFAAGKKRELYSSLGWYECLLPVGAKVFWKSNGLLSVSNPYCPDHVAAKEAVFVPGPFDAGVDMGPDYWSEALKGNC
ncbi:hypothetical protein [Neomoorella thermoacetica]|uniref:hypothetical protein n=1 Tax=Neomoorella thermoacetica TaxID=1525 RepID=UPI00084C23B4|nr:hypothetical protein [Moorella thermoacetica]